MADKYTFHVRGKTYDVALRRDEEDDCVKIEAIVTEEDGTTHYPDLCPYQCNGNLVHLWLWAGLPAGRIEIDGRDRGNWDKQTLDLLLHGLLTNEAVDAARA